MQRLRILVLGGVAAACDPDTGAAKDGSRDDAKIEGPHVGAATFDRGSVGDAPESEVVARGDAVVPAAKGPPVIGAIVLGKLELQAQAPVDSEITDAIVGTGVMVRSSGLVATVAIADETHPKTIDDAKVAAHGVAARTHRHESLADGFMLTYQNEGAMGPNSFVDVRRTIGHHTFWCTSVASTDARRDAAIAFCKSLAPQ